MNRINQKRKQTNHDTIKSELHFHPTAPVIACFAPVNSWSFRLAGDSAPKYSQIDHYIEHKHQFHTYFPLHSATDAPSSCAETNPISVCTFFHKKDSENQLAASETACASLDLNGLEI